MTTPTPHTKQKKIDMHIVLAKGSEIFSLKSNDLPGNETYKNANGFMRLIFPAKICLNYLFSKQFYRLNWY